MENAYGIGVKNRYELFYNEDVDPFEILRKNEEEKVKRKTDKTSPKEKSKSLKNGKSTPSTGLAKKNKDVPLSTKVAEVTESSNKPRPRPFSERNYRLSRNFEESKDFEEKKNFRNHADHEIPFSENREQDGEYRRGRGAFQGRGGRLRGRGGYFNPEGRPPRREFDRHSANEKGSRRKEPVSSWMEEDNVTSSEKQNDPWGEIPIENLASIPDKVDSSNEKTNDPLVESGELKENMPVSDEPSEENAKEMTLDEWKREQQAKRAIPKYNMRKPGEGEDGNQWKKLYILKKKVGDDEEEEDEEEEEDVDDDDFSRRGRQRQIVDIQINFNDARRGRGRGRGARGMGPRSGGDKEMHREDRREPLNRFPGVGRSYRGSMKTSKSGQQSAPRVDDWNDFPSLLNA